MSVKTCGGLVAAMVLLLAANGCGSSSGSGSDSGSPSGPSGSGSSARAALAGVWVGTLSRPDGLAAIAVRWEPQGSNLTGSITLTNGSTSVTFPMNVVTSGPQESVDSIVFQWSATAGTIVTLPRCSILAAGETVAKNLTVPITRIVTGSFTLNYNSCDGFVDPVPPTNGRQETTQLTLTKQ